jgi:hypothetical protein
MLVSNTSRAADNLLPPAAEPVQQIAARQTAMHRWEISLAPLVASQVLDSSSSWGMRELNPVLANPNGGFGARSAMLKLGTVGALIGVEYLIVKRSPRAAHLFEKLNWSGAAVTTGLAIHNYAIR